MSKERVNDALLLAYAAGELDREAAARVEAHLSADAADAERVRLYRGVIETMRSDDSLAPPASAMERARAIFQVAPARRENWLDKLERVIATLIFDSRAEPALAGFRGADTAVQLSFESEIADVDLQLEQQDQPEGEWLVMGQATARREQPVSSVALLPSDSVEPVAEVRPDPHGVFRLQAAAGKYRLAIRVGEQAVVLPDIVIE
jgi:anti-sigma factor RsiW